MFFTYLKKVFPYFTPFTNVHEMHDVHYMSTERSIFNTDGISIYTRLFDKRLRQNRGTLFDQHHYVVVSKPHATSVMFFDCVTSQLERTK